MNPFVAEKIFYHNDRISEWRQTGDTWPVTVEIDLTNRCNHRCPACTGGRARAGAMLPDTLVTQLLDELKEIGAKAVIFTGGGEPLCHSRAATHIDYAASTLCLDVGLITNGELLTAQTVNRLHRCKWVRVSLDADNAEMFRMTHGVDHFARVVENTRLLATNAERNGMTVGVGYLVDSRTVDGMEGASRLCAELGVNYLQFRPFHHSAREVGLFPRMRAGLTRAKQYEGNGYSVVCSEHKFHRMSADNGRPERRYEKCYGQAFAATICADGMVTICCHMRGLPRYTLGNLHENTFTDIWRSERRRKLVDTLDFADCPDYCRCDPFNITLWNLRHNEPDHVNFL